MDLSPVNYPLATGLQGSGRAHKGTVIRKELSRVVIWSRSHGEPSQHFSGSSAQQDKQKMPLVYLVPSSDDPTLWRILIDSCVSIGNARSHQRLSLYGLTAEGPQSPKPPSSWSLGYTVGWACGSTILARHPFLSLRFRSSIEPPWASAICRERTKPIPLPAGLVV